MKPFFSLIKKTAHMTRFNHGSHLTPAPNLDQRLQHNGQVHVCKSWDLSGGLHAVLNFSTALSSL